MKRTAWITLRHQPPYRSDAFAQGLEDLGFKVKMHFPPPNSVAPQDVVVVWNLNPRYRPAAWEAKKSGAALIVAENGYIPRKGATEHYYAIARDGHNGSGWWHVGKEDRWSTLGQTIQPWVDRPGGYILICEQRGIGSENMRCPYGYFERVAPKIKRVFVNHDRKNIPGLRKREHPGRHQPKQTLAKDLEGARAVVTWASNVANEALLAGVPVFRTAPFHVNEATLTDLNQLPNPPQTDREAGFKKLAWAQWSLSEIQDGSAFKSVLSDVL